jgi:nucleotide-binding universal stress UspA family protein
MFKHVLIPTDGSPLSRKAVKAGIAFAKEFGARETAYHAVEAIPPWSAGGFLPPSVLAQAEAGMRKQAEQHLDAAAKIAKAAGVPCESLLTRPMAVYQGIIDAAKKQKCDVIFMASHGRGGAASLLLGSVTLKVLAHSKIPVLVFR